MELDRRVRSEMPWGKVAAAGAAVLVGNGLARFGYAPLLPVLISEGWFAPGAAAYLGAANLLGYLLGALAARRVAAWAGVRPVLRGGMAAAAASLLACCVPLPFAWFFAWRLLSGIVGGLLMILAPSAVMHAVPVPRRGLASGLIFTGIGLGIALSGTLVPLLLRAGLTAAWLSLGAVSVLLTAASWRAWPAGSGTGAGLGGAGGHLDAGEGRGLWLVCVNYGLCAVGLVPYMVFLVDYVARGRGLGLAAGSLAWVLFGVGALFGAVVVGRLADRVGAAAAMRLVIGTELCCLLVLAFVAAPVVSGVGFVVAGLCVSGLTTAMLGRVQDAVGADPVARQRGWTQATVAWAIGQAGAAYGLAWLYARTGGYGALLFSAMAALVLAGGIEGWIGLRRMVGRGVLAGRGRGL